MIGGALISLIELGVFAGAVQRSTGTYRYPLIMIGFNIVVIPLLAMLRRRVGNNTLKRSLVYLCVAFYLGWACFYTWAVRISSPMVEINLPLYVLMAYGAAVFIYMEPLWSAVLFSSSLGLFVAIMPYNQYDQYSAIGNIWNALALNIFAWMTSRLIFVFQLRTYIAQKELEQEQLKSDALLLNILPAKIVAELKKTGKTEPERFDRVTVLFSDLVDFTSISSQMPPDVLISELNDLFTTFDAIIERCACERIKTIGDAYLCVCGMPQAHPHHAQQVLDAALEIVAYLQARNAVQPYQWQIRIGVHTGSVVGGVVGTQKYIYDVFGDTINIAERMQVHSAPMQINVSEATYQLTRESFLFIERGLVQVKGKGEVKMYFCQERCQA